MSKDTDIQIIPQPFDLSNTSTTKLLEALLLAQISGELLFE